MTKKDQRAAPRLEVQVDATLQVLGETSATNGPAMPVRILDTNARGMRLRAAAPMNAGQAVTLEIGDAMFLGEVCYCAPATDEKDKQFYLGIVTRECLTGLASLHHLLRALAPEPAPELERHR